MCEIKKTDGYLYKGHLYSSHEKALKAKESYKRDADMSKIKTFIYDKYGAQHGHYSRGEELQFTRAGDSLVFIIYSNKEKFIEILEGM